MKNTKITKPKEFDYEWYSLQSILGCANWAMFYILLGAREAGKSYAVMKYCVSQWKKKQIPFYWIRLNEASTRKMLSNNAEKMVDPDIYRKYNLKLVVKGTSVFDDNKKMAEVLALSTSHNDKGVALFDKDYEGEYHIVIDEFQLEKSQRKTFDIMYNLVVELENLVRSRKHGIKIFMIGNTTEEASDVLTKFNFIPEKFGRYKLKSKRAVIDYMAPTKTYLNRRKGTVGDILAGNTSNFTNQLKQDISKIYKGRTYAPSYIVKFSKDECDWFTVWDSNVLLPYNGEKCHVIISMRRYIDEEFLTEKRDMIFQLNDARHFFFKNLITQKRFQYELSLIKKQ